MTDEQWLVIEGFDGMYEVSSLGRVRSWYNNRYGELKKPRILKPGRRKGTVPYLVVSLRRDGSKHTKYVHRLVAETFLGKPTDPSLEVGHWDGDPENNEVTNLRWIDRTENTSDKLRHGTHPKQITIR